MKPQKPGPPAAVSSPCIKQGAVGHNLPQAYTVGIRTGFQSLFQGKWVETSYKGRHQLQGRYKGESTRPVIHDAARF